MSLIADLLELYNGPWSPHHRGLVTAALVGTLTFAVQRWRKRTQAQNSDVPRLRQPPNPHWLWGHDYIAWEMLDFQWYRDNSSKSGCGLVYAMKGALFHPDIVVVADPGALSYIYSKRTYQYNKAALFQSLFERVLGRGMVWAAGDTHKRQRALVAPFLSHSRVRMADDALQSLVFRGVAKLRDSLVTGRPSRVDVLPLISHITLDIVGLLCFDYDFGCGDSDDARLIHSTLEHQAKLGMTFAGFVAPLVLRALPWLSKWSFALTAAQEAMKLAVREKIAAALLSKRDEVQNGSAEAFDLLSGLMAETDMDNKAQVDELLDQIVTIVLAGNETSAKTIPLILVELARHPKIQMALRAELTQFQGSRADGRPTYDEYVGSKQLPLLDAVVIEGLRLYPNAEHIDKEAEEDDVIPLRYPVQTRDGQTLTSIKVQKGQVFYFDFVAINTNPYVWGSNGNAFDPYRWITPGGVANVSELTGGINGIFTFGEGPRLCVGYRLALFEIKIILAELLKHFEFAEVPGVNVRTTWATTMQPIVEGSRQEGSQTPLMVSPL